MTSQPPPAVPADAPAELTREVAKLTREVHAAVYKSGQGAPAG